MPETDLILINGDIRTQDDRQPRASAVAITGNRITCVGQKSDVMNHAGPETRLIDLDGRLVLPGFMDSHIHFSYWSMGMRHLELAGIASFNDCLEEIRRKALKAKPGDWIQGHGWNEADWPENRQPRRDDLDAVAPDNPVLIWRCDLHMAAANSAALKEAGIDHSTPNPPEGIILRDEAGRPNGLLRESAIDLVSRKLPQATDGDLLEAYRVGQRVLHGFGVTAIADVPLMSGHERAAAGLRVWQRLLYRSELNLRTWACLPGEILDEAIALGLQSGFGGPYLRLGPVKFFADGGMGARTAWMFEPYLDGGTGMPLLDMNKLAEDVARADRNGLAVMIHAIGDRANHEVIGIFEKIMADYSGERPAMMHRIEHVQMIRPEDAARFKGLGIAANMQPPNLIIDINMIDECMGARGRRTYAFRDIMDSCRDLVFSSDAPVCDHNPLVGIHSAVNRRRTDGLPAGGWHPTQKVSVDEAVRAYTITPAKVHGAADEIGSITPNKYADLVVLNKNIYNVDPMEIASTRVDITLFDGQVVYNHKEHYFSVE